MADVIVVGGGPTGLLLASELRLAGAEPLVLEAAAERDRRTRGLGLRGINGRSVQTAYLVGCDGGRSVVRKRTGIAFGGTEATMTGRTAVAELTDPGALTSSLRGPGGLLNLSLVPGEIATIEFDGGPSERDTPVTARELEDSIRRVSGVD